MAPKDSRDPSEVFVDGKTYTWNRVREEQEGLLQPAGVEDVEMVARDCLLGVLSEIIGSDEMRRLGDRMASDLNWDGMLRLCEFRDPGICHDWQGKVRSST